jgi:hypothetical protein
MTVSVVREAFSRLIALRELSLAAIVRELEETLRRKEEARIYHYFHNTGAYPPRRQNTAGERIDGSHHPP